MDTASPPNCSSCSRAAEVHAALMHGHMATRAVVLPESTRRRGSRGSDAWTQRRVTHQGVREGRRGSRGSDAWTRGVGERWDRVQRAAEVHAALMHGHPKRTSPSVIVTSAAEVHAALMHGHWAVFRGVSAMKSRRGSRGSDAWTRGSPGTRPSPAAPQRFTRL